MKKRTVEEYVKYFVSEDNPTTEQTAEFANITQPNVGKNILRFLNARDIKDENGDKIGPFDGIPQVRDHRPEIRSYFRKLDAETAKANQEIAKTETAKANQEIAKTDILTNESIKECIKQLKKNTEVQELMIKESQTLKEFIKENPKEEEIPLKSYPFTQEIIKSSSNFKSYEESKKLVRSMGLRTREEYLNKKEVENFIKIAEKELYESKKLPYTIFGLCLILLIFLVVWTLFFYGRIGILAIGITFLVILSINLFIPNLLNWIASISEFFGRTVFKLLEKISKRKS